MRARTVTLKHITTSGELLEGITKHARAKTQRTKRSVPRTRDHCWNDFYPKARARTQINQVAQFAQDHKVDFSFRPVNFSGIYYRNKSGEIVEGYDMISSRKHVHKLITNLERIWGILKSLTRIAYIKGALEYMEKGRRTLRCTAASRSLFLDPYGNVYPCLFKEKKVGNIREQILKEIWNSPAAKKTRMEINQLECPPCWVECEVYRELKNAPLRLISSVLTAVSVLLSSLLHGNRTRS